MPVEKPDPTLISQWFIPLAPYWTPNKLRGKHWRVAAKNAREWRENVAAVCGRPKNPCATRRRLGLTVTRPWLLDPDNEVAAMKPLIDALKRQGWIKNDSTRWLDLHVWQKQGMAAVVIELWELGEAPPALRKARL